MKTARENERNLHYLVANLGDHFIVAQFPVLHIITMAQFSGEQVALESSLRGEAVIAPKEHQCLLTVRVASTRDGHPRLLRSSFSSTLLMLSSHQPGDRLEAIPQTPNVVNFLLDLLQYVVSRCNDTGNHHQLAQLGLHTSVLHHPCKSIDGLALVPRLEWSVRHKRHTALRHGTTDRIRLRHQFLRQVLPVPFPSTKKPICPGLPRRSGDDHRRIPPVTPMAVARLSSHRRSKLRS